MSTDDPYVQLTACPLTRARRVLYRIEGEIEKNWRYADFPHEALGEIKLLAETLREILGPEAPPSSSAQMFSPDRRRKEFRQGQGSSAEYLLNDRRKKLTDEQVVEIRRRYKTSDVKQQTLADEYGVSQRLICLIVRDQIRKNAGVKSP
jgi:hypothetical protein